MHAISEGPSSGTHTIKTSICLLWFTQPGKILFPFFIRLFKFYETDSPALVHDIKKGFRFFFCCLVVVDVVVRGSKFSFHLSPDLIVFVQENRIGWKIFQQPIRASSPGVPNKADRQNKKKRRNGKRYIYDKIWNFIFYVFSLPGLPGTSFFLLWGTGVLALT